MPFYFQASLESSPLRSGIDYMSLAVPQMIGLLAGGGITTASGHYVSPTTWLVSLDINEEQTLDAGHLDCSGDLWGRVRVVDNTPNKHEDGALGNIHGTHRPRSWFRSQRSAYRCSSCYANVSTLVSGN